nr:hypothetical protein [uncultured Dongia sp.]
MNIFRNYVKTLAVLALLGGGLSGCTVTRAYDLAADGQINQLQQVACNDRIGGNN